MTAQWIERTSGNPRSTSTKRSRSKLSPGAVTSMTSAWPRVAALPHDEVAEVASGVCLRVSLQPFLARPVAHAVADGVAEVGREPAALDLEHLVPAARLVEAERGAGGRPRERVLELVAVVEDRLGRDDLLERRLGDAAEAAQRVRDLALLLLELHLVGEILEAAAAAGGIVRARRLDALRARRENVDGERLRVAPLHLRHARPHAVAREAAADEDDVAVQPRNTVAAVREGLDVELDFIVTPNGSGHGTTVALPSAGARYAPGGGTHAFHPCSG